MLQFSVMSDLGDKQRALPNAMAFRLYQSAVVAAPSTLLVHLLIQ